MKVRSCVFLLFGWTAFLCLIAGAIFAAFVHYDITGFAVPAIIVGVFTSTAVAISETAP